MLILLILFFIRIYQQFSSFCAKPCYYSKTANTKYNQYSL